MKALWFGVAFAVAIGCGKKDKPPEPAVGSGSAIAAPVAETDHVVVLAHHHHPKPADPVKIKFDRVKVVKADFDPTKIEGGTATVEIDLSSFKTDSDERDEHLKSPAYLDVGKFATATIAIDHVKHTTDKSYTADAAVSIHGMSKTYPVTFDVIEVKGNAIRIKGQQAFSRLDFGIGADPAKDDQEQVGTDLTIEMVLTLETPVK